MFFSADKLYFNRTFGLFLILFLALATAAAVESPAQTRKTGASKKPEKNKIETRERDAKKPAKSETSKAAENKKQTAEDQKRAAAIAAAREREEQKRREQAREAELARQRAALEERRRREQAAREARARFLAFERGLKTETQENIADDDATGEDLEVRRAAVSALGNHAGTVVVMEPQTGKILSIVNQDWGIRKGFKPCSTIKLVTGVAGLNERVIDESGAIRPRPFPMDLTDALAFSNNGYFQRAGVNFGNEKMIAYARSLGLGEPTGINAEGESAGRLPFGNHNPRIYSHGDDFEVTPLQLAVMVSAISNGGKIVVPQIPRPAARNQKISFRGQMRRQINFSRDHLEGVLPGMVGAVTYGTARRSNGAELNVAGKTGSCIGQGSWVGLFASVAPVVNPQIAVVVVTRGQSERGKYASMIAGKIYQAISHRFKDARRQYVASTPLELVKPQPKIRPQDSALLDDGEDEESDFEDGFLPLTGKPSAKKPETDVRKNAVTVARVESKPLPPQQQQAPAVKINPKVFEPVVIRYKRDVEADEDSGALPTRPRIVKTNKTSHK